MCSSDYREGILQYLDLISVHSAQLEYEKNVPIADVAAELMEMFYDLHHTDNPSFRAGFSETEISELCRFEGLLDKIPREVETLDALRMLPEWDEVVKFARQLRYQMRTGGT